MSNSTTGLQPYQLLFVCKAQTPCDNWLGLNNHDSSESGCQSLWVQEQHMLMQAIDLCALKSIQRSAEQSALRTDGNELSIQEVNLVLLQDHP